MKKRYVETASLSFIAAVVLGCSGGAGDGSVGASGSAVSQGTGPCDAPILQVIVKEKEHRFGVDDQQVALNPEIPIQNICQNGVLASCKTACFDAEAAAVATGVKGFSGSNVPAQLHAMGELADAFNRALGNTSDFADHPIDQDPGVTNPNTDPNAITSAAPPSDSGTTDASPAAVACDAPVLQVIVKGQEHRFGVGDEQVALNPEIPIQNICQNGVAAGCKNVCFTAEAAAVASGVKGFSGSNVPAQLRAMGELADTFNRALGNASDFADQPIDQDPGVTNPSTDPNASTD